jgi:hypothetical protein
MTTLNDLAYAALGGGPLTLTDRLKTFEEANGLTGNDSQMAFLAAYSGTLNDRWYQYWSAAGLIIAGGEADLTAGAGNGTRVGFRAGVYGDLNPDVTSRNDPINALFVRNSTGRVRFKVQGEYARTSFSTMTIVGQGTLLEADANYDFDGAETEWVWSGTGFSLSVGDTYIVNFT